MKIVIADYPDVLGRDLDYEINLLKSGLPGAEVCVVPYADHDQESFYRCAADAQALLTAFIPLSSEALSHLPQLKCVGLNSTGYDFVDYQAATQRNIAIIPIGEYCTREVADHTMALLLSLARGLKHYIADVDNRRRWQYYSIEGLKCLDGCTLAIFGFGKIGSAVAKRAAGFGLRILAIDPRLTEAAAKENHVIKATPEQAWEEADILSNHMNRTESNQGMFCMDVFRKLKKHPIFINCGRGGCVCQKDLIQALDEGLISAAGLDVLEEESPDLERCGLTNRENVILTPHAAFYSESSIRSLQRISCENVVHYLKGEYEQVFKIVNQNEITLPS